jgi:hypothetical protein
MAKLRQFRAPTSAQAASAAQAASRSTCQSHVGRYDNLELRTSEVPLVAIERTVRVSWPVSATINYSVEAAPNVQGPWLPVQDSVFPGFQQITVPASEEQIFVRFRGVGRTLCISSFSVKNHGVTAPFSAASISAHEGARQRWAIPSSDTAANVFVSGEKTMCRK